MRQTILLLPLLGLLSACDKGQNSQPTAATLEDLNRALDAVVMHSNGKFPPDTNEIVRFLGVWGKTMPVPPAGQRLELDPKTRHYVFTSGQ